MPETKNFPKSIGTTTAMGSFAIAGTLLGALGAIRVDEWAEAQMAEASGEQAAMAIAYGFVLIGTPSIALVGAMVGGGTGYVLVRWVRPSVVTLCGAAGIAIAAWTIVLANPAVALP